MLGRHIPDVTLKTRVRDDSVEGPNPFRWQDRQTGDLLGSGRVVLFALPGAFTQPARLSNARHSSATITH